MNSQRQMKILSPPLTATSNEIFVKDPHFTIKDSFQGRLVHYNLTN